jgi:hypothetical protein
MNARRYSRGGLSRLPMVFFRVPEDRRLGTGKDLQVLGYPAHFFSAPAPVLGVKHGPPP